jgi:predicted PolB exonuclease-like 3'-5' exonuclease
VKALFHAEEFQGCLQLNIRNLRPAVDGEPAYDATMVFGAGWPLVRDLACRTLVFDIETVPAVERRSLPTTVAESLARAAERFESDEAKVMGLSPYFGKVVSLAVADADEVDDGPPREAGEGGASGPRGRGGEARVTAFVVPNPEAPAAPLPAWVRPVSEPELLEAWWALAGVADTVVSFNGRGFDVPFLVVRSLLQGIPARVDLLGNRYGLRPHLDLHRALTSGERVHGPANLDVLCWALGLESPKGEMDGSMVAPAYARGELARIAEYNARDVRATAAVYRAVRDRVLRFRDDW